MTLPVLRDDSLITTPGGTAVRVSLPWIRSLPLASLQDPIVTIDGVPAGPVSVADRDGAATALADDDAWWFQQDRMTLTVPHEAGPGAHDVTVEFGLRIPYLQVGPDGPAHASVPRRAAARARRAARARSGAQGSGAARERRLAPPELGAHRERLQLDTRDDRGRA